MDSLIFHWVFTLIILVVLLLLTDIGIASVVTMFIVVLKFMSQSYTRKTNMFSNFTTDQLDEGNIPEIKKLPDEKTPVNYKSVQKPKKSVNSILTKELMRENKQMLDAVLNPESQTMDDRVFDASIESGRKSKKAKDIRSHWNNNNWKKYYDYELGIHEQSNRDWWTDDDLELSKKHSII
jgi:hypothetical protein